MEWVKIGGDKAVFFNLQSLEVVCSERPCKGIASGFDLTGWTWATKEETHELLLEFTKSVPDVGLVNDYPALTRANNFKNAMGLVTFSSSEKAYSEDSFAYTSSKEEESGRYITAGSSWGHNGSDLTSFIGFSTAAETPERPIPGFFFRQAQEEEPPIPTPVPTVSPTPTPTVVPTPVPTISPTPVPTISPTPIPTIAPPLPTPNPRPRKKVKVRPRQDSLRHAKSGDTIDVRANDKIDGHPATSENSVLKIISISEGLTFDVETGIVDRDCDTKRTLRFILPTLRHQ